MQESKQMDLEKTLADLRLQVMEQQILIKQILSKVENNHDAIKIRTLIIVMILSYILFLGEKVKEVLNLDFIKALLS